MSGCWPPATRSATSTESTMSPYSGRWPPATRRAASTESTTSPGRWPKATRRAEGLLLASRVSPALHCPSGSRSCSVARAAWLHHQYRTLQCRTSHRRTSHCRSLGSRTTCGSFHLPRSIAAGSPQAQGVSILTFVRSSGSNPTMAPSFSAARLGAIGANLEINSFRESGV